MFGIHSSNASNTSRFSRIAATFGLSPNALYKILEATHACIAGGSALSAFLNSPMQDGQDIDIWLPTPVSPRDGLLSNYPFEKAAILLIENFLLASGYMRDLKAEMDARSGADTDIEYLRPDADKPDGWVNPFVTTIRRIHRYKNGWDQKIQIIECYNVSIEHILKSFDLDVCQFFVDRFSGPDLNVRHNHSAEVIERIKNGIMTPVPNSEFCPGTARTQRRVDKYQARGFKFA